MSKGSRPRPFSVSQKEYDNRWDAIFGRDLKKEEDAKNEDEEFKRILDQNKFDQSVIMKEEYYDLEDGASPPKDSVQQG